MMRRQAPNTTDLHAAMAALCDGLDGASDGVSHYQETSSAMLPSNVRTLLAHTEHMTSTLEAYHGRKVSLHVLREVVTGDLYAREILLTLADTNTVVEYGIMRFDLSKARTDVRKEVLAQSAPLGDILTRHDILRRIDPRWFVRFDGQSNLISHFGTPRPTEVFGRVAVIYCDRRVESPATVGLPATVELPATAELPAAIELLEVVTDRRHTL